jgi:hypothetical protein
VDGFKLLTHIRTNASMPIIVLSGLYVRSSDRIKSAELGADYYMTKPFSVKELRQKARQLIARYRGIGDWIANQPEDRIAKASFPPLTKNAPFEEKPAHAGAGEEAEAPRPASRAPESGRPRTARSRGIRSGTDHFLSYQEFIARVEENVSLGMETGTTFSIVGCRMPDEANGTVNAVRLYGLINAIVRNDDLISMNPRDDFVVLLSDADAAGAKAFIVRLLDRVVNEMSSEPLVWLRSFPHREEATEVTWLPVSAPARVAPAHEPVAAAPIQTSEAGTATARTESPKSKPAERLDPRESYINLLKNL